MNEQRKVIYEQRRELMQDEDISDFLADVREELVESLVDEYLNEEIYPEEWNTKEFTHNVKRQFGISVDAEAWKSEDGVTSKVAFDRTMEAVNAHNAKREEEMGAELVRYMEKTITLQILDYLWKDHLLNMDHLKEGIHLRGYAQKDPLNEYKREAFELFDNLLQCIKGEAVEVLSRVEAKQPEEIQSTEEERASKRDLQLSMSHAESGAFGDEEAPEREVDAKTPFRRQGEKIGRNAPCPCGSGKKYKQCCGRMT